MKNITAVGYLTKDCEVVESEKSSFVKFSIAVDDGYGDNKGTIFFGARYFRTNISPYLLKGKLVAITGDLKKNEYEGKTYLSINATEVKLLGGKSNEPKRLAEGQKQKAITNYKISMTKYHFKKELKNECYTYTRS